MARPENRRVAVIEAALADATRIFPAVAVVIARQRMHLTKADIAELETIVDAAAHMQRALQALRREEWER